MEDAAKACDFTKSNTPPWVFFTFFILNCTNDFKSRKKLDKQ